MRESLLSPIFLPYIIFLIWLKHWSPVFKTKLCYDNKGAINVFSHSNIDHCDSFHPLMTSKWSYFYIDNPQCPKIIKKNSNWIWMLTLSMSMSYIWFNPTIYTFIKRAGIRACKRQHREVQWAHIQMLQQVMDNEQHPCPRSTFTCKFILSN